MAHETFRIKDYLVHSDRCTQCIYAVVVDRFYIALFSALEHTHCALVACDSK